MVICKICNKEFETFKELSKHLILEHNYNTLQVYNYFDYSFNTGRAICPVCGKEFMMTKRQIDGFKKNPDKSIGCCTSCSKALIIVTHGSPLANPEIYEKTKKTLKKNYGVEHPAQSAKVLKKMKATTKERLGVENAMQSEKVQRKRKKTNLERYGNEEFLATKEARDKVKERMLEKYGVENAFQAEEVKSTIKQVHLKKRGVEHPMQSKESIESMKRTNLERRGVEFPLQSEESMENMKKTNLERRGVEYTFQDENVRRKSKERMLEVHGVEYPLQSPKVQEKMKKRSQEKYNTDYFLQSPEVRQKGVETNLEKYGVPNFCQHERCYKYNNRRISNINRNCYEFLKKNSIESELEFILENSGYDLKVDTTLIEIDPSFTHNSTIGPKFGGKETKPRSSTYHLEKTEHAKEHGYDCIHIFDGDDWNKIVYLLQSKEQVAARKCECKEIESKEANSFLEKYHLQGGTRQVQHAYGLFYKNELVQVMTFGKPRYNKNYEYELLRLCTASGVSVIGGASKLLKYFEEQVKPKSLLSYCDLSKFNGEVYEKLGFTLVSQTAPAKHWYNPKTKVHITDNLLRQRGFDQLHNANFGKGTSNQQLMLEHGYVEIYDCGQLVFVKNFSK